MKPMTHMKVFTKVVQETFARNLAQVTCESST